MVQKEGFSDEELRSREPDLAGYSEEELRSNELNSKMSAQVISITEMRDMETTHSEVRRPRRSAVRALFGIPSPQSRQYARDRVNEIREQDKINYNFDFDTEKPLPGRYQWEAVYPVDTPHQTKIPSSATSTATSEQALKDACTIDLENREALLIAREGVERVPIIGSMGNSVTSVNRAPSPSQRLSSSPETYPQKRVSQRPSSSSVSSQSSPGSLVDPPIPSSPSSMEEAETLSSSPSSSTDDRIREESTSVKKEVRKKNSSQKSIKTFMPETRKRQATTQAMSPSAEKKAAL